MENMSVKAAANWMPSDRSVLKAWVDEQINQLNLQKNSLDAGSGEEYTHKSVRNLKNLIETRPEIYVLANQMIHQALKYSEEDPYGAPQITSYQMMLMLIDHIIKTAPEYMKPDQKGSGLIGFPVNAVLNWCMGTPAGYAFFLNKEVNRAFEDILKEWCEFLNSEESLYVLNKGDQGWMCEKAKCQLNMDEYVYNEKDEHWGYRSWNDFFTRQFKEGVRPVGSPDDPNVIVCACESQTYRISNNVKVDDCFWLKGQSYSLKYMLNQSEFVDTFAGGTVYQAFLSATRYHRWHSPVDGVIEKVELVPGTYYSEIQEFPFDPAGPNESQGFITQVATRAIIYIKCQEPIGLMCFMAVGMAEVSSCIVSVNPGDEVKKGDPLGYFQFGGSTHCLIFRKNVKLDFVPEAIPAEDFNDSAVLKVKSRLAVVK